MFMEWHNDDASECAWFSRSLFDDISFWTNSSKLPVYLKYEMYVLPMWVSTIAVSYSTDPVIPYNGKSNLKKTVCFFSL